MTMALVVARDDEVLVEGEIRHVFVDTATWKKTRDPGRGPRSARAVDRGRRLNLKPA